MTALVVVVVELSVVEELPVVSVFEVLDFAVAVSVTEGEASPLLELEVAAL